MGADYSRTVQRQPFILFQKGDENMTVETKVTIEFRDIIAVEFECPKCHTRISRQLTEDNHLPEKCKGGMCQQVFFADSSLEFGSMLNALNLIGRYAKAKDLPFKLRLELSGLTSKPSVSQT
jgi:hypothetical protein